MRAFAKMKILMALSALAGIVSGVSGAAAQSRAPTLPPVVMSPDLAAPWVMQLREPRRAPANRFGHVPRGFAREVRNTPSRSSFPPAPRPPQSHAAMVRPVTVTPAPMPDIQAQTGLDPIYLPQQVAYSGGQRPGTIVIDTANRFLYLVGEDGTARRYGVGVGKEGFSWRGTETISRKAEWPDWRPPAQMIAREREKGRILPAHMPGGPQNPLGARALYLGSTLYRIHGTNQPSTIGQAVSSGCIRMRNEDVIDLYGRVGVGTRVVVI